MRTDFIKIRVFIPLKQNQIIVRNGDGSFIGSEDFVELAQEADAKFREPIITYINDAVGLHNWAIKFIQFDPSGECFDARLYCDSKIDAFKMTGIISERIPGIIFNWLHSGTISDYLKAG